MAERLRGASGVQDVRWSARSRSLVVRYDTGLTISEVLERLPADGSGPKRRSASLAQDIPSPWWREMLPPALSLAAGVLAIPLASTAVVAACAVPIGRRALRNVRRGRLSIDLLDATAVTLLLGTGDLVAAGVSVSLIESGERLRRQASGRAGRVVRHWMGADERGVRLLRKGTEPRVPVEVVALGDRAVVYAGEIVPVDGRVVAGSGSVDNRTWTGEPFPVVVSTGDRLLAGATVVDGRVVMEITAVAEGTRAGHLAAAIEEALAANTPTTDMARRIADRFVAPVLVGSGLAYLLTSELTRVVSMLIVDFGTGIRIGVPTSFLATMVAGARRQVLFKSGRAIESLASVDTIVFDKTGTLTRGRPAVVGVDAAPGFDSKQVVRLAAAAEGHLPHPIARAIRRYARTERLELLQPSEVRTAPGGGVEALIEGQVVHVGARSYLEAMGVDVPRGLTTDATVAMVAVDGRHAGRIRLHDGLRDEARQVIQRLRSLGVSSLWLATGDRSTVANRLAASLGLDEVRARLMPEDKVDLVRRLRADGRSVAVIGDGINDAAAMAEANVGVAVAHGADLARQSADVVLGTDALDLLVEALELSRFSMHVVREDMVLVAAPNAAALIAATLGMLPPLAATIVNNGSTLLTGANSLRPLRRTGSED